MAEEVEIAKNSLDVLSEVFQLGATFSQVSNIIKFSGSLAPAFPIVGALLVFIGNFLPDGQHQDILRNIKALGNEIDQVRNDMNNLKNAINLGNMHNRYGPYVENIELGMKYWFQIANARGKDVKMMYQNRLIEHCAGGKCNRDLNSLLEGLSGTGLFSGRILETFYHVTGGDRPRISALATRLLQLVSGGTMVISTYDTIMLGENGTAVVPTIFYHQLNETCRKVQSVLDRCVQNFRGNMLSDLNRFLDEGGSNVGILAKIRNSMSDKYDWLENFCLVYNDVYGSENHWISGYYVHSFHRKGKCGVVYYRTKGPMFSNRYDEAYNIVDDVYNCNHAQHCTNSIVANLNDRRIEWMGCAVIKSDRNLLYGGTFSTKIVDIDKMYATIGWWNSWTPRSVKAILLLK